MVKGKRGQGINVQDITRWGQSPANWDVVGRLLGGSGGILDHHFEGFWDMLGRFLGGF